MSTYKFRFAVCECNFWKFILDMDPVREIHTAQKIVIHCDVTSMVFANYSKQNLSGKKQNNELLKKKLPTHFTLSLH